MARTKKSKALAFAPRQATPRATFGYTGPDGEQRELVADADGAVYPEIIQDVGVLKSFGLPVIEGDTRVTDDNDPADAGDDDQPAETGKEG